MSVLNKIAYYQNRRDEVPNQELAQALAQTRSQADIREIAEALWNKEPGIQSDCLKVLYELGYLAPELIAEYTGDFLKLLKHRNNRMVWGGMIALSTVADIKAAEIFPHFDQIVQAMQEKKIPVTYALYPDEGHGFARPGNGMSFYALMEAFLSINLGGRYEPIGRDLNGSSITIPVGADHVPDLVEALAHKTS